MTPSLEAIRAAGVPGAERVVAALVPVADRLAGVPADDVLAGLARAADPAGALHGLERLAPLAPGTSPRVDLLLRLLGGSPTLAATLAAEGAAWPELFRNVLDVPVRDAAAHAAALARDGTSGPLPRATLQSRLRLHRRREVVRIGGRDLLGLASVDDTVRELSALADAVADVAVACTRSRLAAEWGGDVPIPFVVLGMGKLGGEELNFSSDVDLVYVYAGDGEHPSGRTAREFFVRLGEEVTRAIAEPTGDGFCFRVDLRLRPGGGQGPLAVSIPAALDHYEGWGETWERAAWLKARPVAGDRALGARLIAELGPFVYRRYLDFATIDDLKAMKRKVDDSLRSGAYERDVKLGRGGIREVEFWVQAHQLVHGGKDSRLQVRGTLAALARLQGGGYVDATLAARLADAYRFLRDVEHKIQVVHERQTQRIPDDPEAERGLARRLGFLGPTGTDDFRVAHAAHANLVHATFEALFHGAETARRRDERPEMAPLMDELDDEARSRKRLAALGFREDTALADLRTLRDGPRHTPPSARRRRVIAALAPALVAALADSPDPDRALAHLASFVTTIGARSSFLHLLLENPGVMRLFVRLFGTSEFLSRYFLRHPELLDSLVRADLVRLTRSREEMGDELRSRLAASPDLESTLDTIRRFRHEEFLRIGVHDIEGELAGDAVRAQLTLLAEVCIGEAVEVAADAVRSRLGLPDETPARGLAVVGMGKLGGGELNYHSDLDLVFVYDAGDDAWWRAHAPGLAPHEYMTRVAQRTLSALQTPTREGIAYHVDTRLRPSGNQGTLVTSLAAFAAYHASSAALWERQALVKARVLTGPPALAAAIGATIERFVYGRGLEPDEAREMAAMRARIADERGGHRGRAVNIKTDAGGLVDVEFVVQMLQLRDGHREPRLRVRPTREALDALIATGVLSRDDGERLRAGYAFLRDLEGRMRIERDQAVEELDTDADALAALARRLGYDGDEATAAAALAATLAAHRAAIRDVYERTFAEAAV